MTRKKDLIVAVLTSFCLIALFLAIPSRSQTGTSSSSNYNPLADLDHDGIIDIYDAIIFSRAFGSSGDPTLPVNVTSMPYDVEYETINFSNTGWVTVNSSYGVPSDVFFCGGYSRMGITMAPIDSSGNSLGNYTVTFYLSSLSWTIENNGAPSAEYLGTDFNMTVYVSSTLTYLDQQAFLTETKAPYCSPYIWILSSSSTPSKWWILLNVYIYFRNE